jgi:serine/threonine protein kinase
VVDDDDFTSVTHFYKQSTRLQSGVYMKVIQESDDSGFSQDVRWMAPECIRDAEYTYKSDVWAMGVVIYEVALI